MSQNLAPIPEAWTTSNTGMHFGIGGVANVVLDNQVTFSGSPSIRIDPVGSTDNYVQECNSKWSTIKPGDHIVFKVWIKPGPKVSGETDRGARIGIDFYGNGGRIQGIQTPDGTPWTTNGWPSNEDDNFVTWGSNWKQIVMDFVVPATYQADYWPGQGYKTGDSAIPTGIIPWLQVCSSTKTGQAWFSNIELYINPEKGEEKMVKKTFSGKLSAVDNGAKISGVTVKITVTGDVTDTLTATTDQNGDYGVSKDYSVTSTKNCTAIASIDADSANASASTSQTAFQIIFSLLKRALTLTVT